MGKFKKAFKLSRVTLLSLSLSVTYYPTVASAATTTECTNGSKQLQDHADSIDQKANAGEAAGGQATANALAGNNTINIGADALGNFGRLTQGMYSEAAGMVGQLKAQCQKACSPPSADEDGDGNTKKEAKKNQDELKKCEDKTGAVEQKLAQAAGEAGRVADGAEKTEDASNPGGDPSEGSGGGMSPMMAGLLGAAAGALAGYMLGKKKNEDKDKDSVVDKDGNVDCTKAGSEAYSDCNDTYLAKCAEDFSSSVCKNFSGRYCAAVSSQTPANNSTPVNQTDSGVIIASAEDKDIKGEGVGSQFCFTVQATDFCTASNRAECPSCQQLQTNKAAACKSNPALCLAQNSKTDIDAAKTSCPNDPLFSNPDYMAGGGSKVPSELQTGEDPILPMPYSSNEGTDVASIASAGGEAVIGANSEMAGGVAVGGGNSEMAGNGFASGGTGVGVSGSSSAFGGSGSAADMARARAIRAGIRGPANSLNVASAVGPSLFAVSSEIIGSRCKRKLFVHCVK